MSSCGFHDEPKHYSRRAASARSMTRKEKIWFRSDVFRRKFPFLCHTSSISN
jgi:hypothetical protein